MMHFTEAFNENSWLRFLLNDTMTNLVIFSIAGVLAFLILVWFAARRMRAETKQAYDDYVHKAAYQSTDYAQHEVNNARIVKITDSVSQGAVAMALSSRIVGRIRMILAENLNRRPLTKVAVVVGYCVVVFFAGLIGAARLAEAVDEEAALLQKIQTASNFRLYPLPENATEVEQTTRLEQARQIWENGLQLCD